jgi:hypothetical protein
MGIPEKVFLGFIGNIYNINIQKWENFETNKNDDSRT